MTRISRALVVIVVVCFLQPGPSLLSAEDPSASRVLSFEERVGYQQRIEEVYWRYRTESVAATTTPVPFEEAVPDSVIRAKVEKGLKQSEALARYWDRPIMRGQLQAEMNRMARETRMPDRLQELFATLDNDPYVIAEVLARPILAERLLRNWWEGSERFENAGAHSTFDEWWAEASREFGVEDEQAAGAPEGEGLDKPLVTNAECTPDSWQLFHPGFPGYAEASVWTGSEMIVYDEFETWRYDPATDSWNRATPIGAPQHRGCTAVWTGTEMLVWGGESLGGDGHYHLTNAGGRYDPSADAWQPTSTGAGVPDQRETHTAIWTGTEMIVWGGSIGSVAYTNTGGRYDPATDSWTPTAVDAETPTIRIQHSAVWADGEMIVWGGRIEDDQGFFYEVNTGGRYDPVTDAWTPTSLGANVPAARASHAAVWTGDQMIVWAGYYYDGGSIDLNTGGRYDPEADTWLPTSTGEDVPVGGDFDSSMVWSGTEMLVWRGPGNQGRYEPTADKWAPMSTGPDAPGGRGLTVWSGTEMIVWDHSSRQGRYDPDTDTWVPIDTSTDLPGSRRYHTAVWTGAEMIVWGGCCSTNTGDRYDPVTNVWLPTSTGADVPSARSHHTAVWTGAEMIVWGGGTDTGSANTGGRYDPVADTWAPTSTIGAPLPRAVHTAVWSGTEMIVWGGQLTDGTKTDTGGRYDPGTDTWGATSTGSGVPAERRDHIGVWTGTEMIVWGGDSGSGFLNTGGRYDPGTNTWAPTSTGPGVPTSRTWFTGLWSGAEMIVWGGWDRSGPATDTGGRYDPIADAWTPTSNGPGVPLARTNHTAVWTGDEMIVWGGKILALSPQEGGRYNPLTDSWQPTAVDDGTPGGRYDSAAVWTGVEDQRMVVWGGQSVDASRGGLYCAAACFAPGPSTSLGFLPDRVTLAWSVQPGATAYDVVKGDLMPLRSGPGDFVGSISACLMGDGTETQVQDTATPSAGEGFYYLFRSIGCEALAGTYDSGGIGQQGSRDAGIAGSGNACP